MDFMCDLEPFSKIRSQIIFKQTQTHGFIVWTHLYFLHGYEGILHRFSILNAKQKQPGAVKKGVAKQSRIKNIVWHLKWLVRTRADISLRRSGLVRPRTDIKLWPSGLVRTRTDTKLQPIGLVRSYKDWYKSKYTCKSFKLSFGRLLESQDVLQKSGQMTI